MTRPAAAGHIPNVIDTNGNGVLDEGWVAANEPVDPTKDIKVSPGHAYSVIPNPVDGSVWISYSVILGVLTRYDPETQLPEVYEVPYMDDRVEIEAYLPHGIDVDRRTGVIRTGLNSGHFAEFDRSRCSAPLSGPEATGRHYPEGWTLHQAPGSHFKGVTDSYYLNWVDWYNTSGLGDNTPILTGSTSDSLIAFVDGDWVILRVPYPLGFHPRGLAGRIDDPNAGWKGRGLWLTQAAQATWRQEGGKGVAAEGRSVPAATRPAREVSRSGC